MKKKGSGQKLLHRILSLTMVAVLLMGFVLPGLNTVAAEEIRLNSSEQERFDAATGIENFDLYSNTDGGFTVQDGRLTPTGTPGEFKAIYKDNGQKIKSVSVEMHPHGNDGMYGGLYIGAANAGNGQDAINAYYVGIESHFTGWEDAPNRLDVIFGQFSQGWAGEPVGGRFISETGLNNALFTGGNKQPICIHVLMEGNVITVTVSLVSNPAKKISTVYTLPAGTDLSLGDVGIRSQVNPASYDNFVVEYQNDGSQEPGEEPDQETLVTDTLDFSVAEKFDLYHSSNGGFAVTDGKLVPTGDAGEFKAIYRNSRVEAIRSVSVDIVPGTSGAMVGGLYIGASNPDHPLDKVNAVYVGIESNFPHSGEAFWSDAPNRTDILVGQFPVWQEYSRTVSETGLGNNLFVDGVKEPVRLTVDIAGNRLTITLSLVSNPARKITTTHVAADSVDFSQGLVGIRSPFNDAAYDNFTVTYVESDQLVPTDKVDFEAAENSDKFHFYHSSNGGFAVENGKLVPSGDAGEFKAIYKDTNAKFNFVSVDIIPGANAGINGGLYIDVTDVDHPVDAITGMYIGIESNYPHPGAAFWDDAPNRIDLYAGLFPQWNELFRVISETGAGNALYSGGVKEPINLCVEIDGNKLTVTVTLISDPAKNFSTVYEYQGEGNLSLGNVGIRSQHCDASYDNFAVGYEQVAADKEPDLVPEAPNPTPTEVVDFESVENGDKFHFYHSSNGGFAVENGKLVPTGETGEFKAIFKDTNAKFSFVKVDIIPGQSNKINAGLYIDVTDANHPQDQITGLYFGLEGNFPHEGEANWADAGNRMDMIAGCFPVWAEYFRLITETGAGNALFTGGVKEPVTLLIQINGKEVTMTVSLVSDPTRFVSKTYEYQGEGDLSLGNVGIRSQVCDASFDNFAVGYETVEADKDPDIVPSAPNPTPTEVVDFESANSGDQFKFYHSSNGGFAVENGKLVPTGQSGEFKAIFKDTNAKFSFVKVDIIPGQSNMIDAGLYIDVTNADHPIDKITGLYFGLEGNFPREGEANWDDAGNRMDMIAGCFPVWTEYFRLVTETGAGNALFTGGVKEPVTLLIQINGKEVTMTVSRVSDPTRFVSKTYEYLGEGDLSLGNVGIRSRMCDASFDNFAVGYETVEADKEQDTTTLDPNAKPTVLVDFNNKDSKGKFDFYHSSTGGLTVKDGKLVPTGKEGEFKAIYRDGGNAIQSVSVDIYPGKSGEINSGIYIGTSTVEHGVDMIKGLVVMVESVSTGWEDAVNRIDLVVGRFPVWNELYRYTSETGNGNALFTGKKEPLRLRVDIIGNQLTVTLSLLSNPDKFVSTVYHYNGATNLSAHNVGLRSAFNDVAFDDFAVYTVNGGGSNDSANTGSTGGSGSSGGGYAPGGSNPPTGDTFRPEFALAVMLLCMAAAVTLGLKKRKI